MNKKINLNYKAALSAVLAAVMLFSFAGCSLFGSHKKKSHKDDDDEEYEEETEEEETESETETEPSVPSETETSETDMVSQDSPEPSYRLEIELDTENDQIIGQMTVGFTNTADVDLTEIYFRDYPAAFLIDKGEYDVTEITNVKDNRSGSDVEIARDGSDMTTVIVKLDDPVMSGSYVEISLDFVTVIPATSDRFGYFENIYSLTDFYPILCRFDKDGNWSHEPYYFTGECFYTDMSDYDVELTVPSDMVVATGGQIISEETDGDTKLLQITATDIRDFAFVASADFEVLEQTEGGITYYVYYAPNGYIDQDIADRAMETCVNSISYFGECFGEYPYPTFSCVFSPMGYYAGGMEYSGMVLIACDAYYDDPEDFFAGSVELVTAHECGHQWFMGIVGSDSYNEAWLDEGFASYTEWVYCKKFFPDQAVDGPTWLGYDISTTIGEYDGLKGTNVNRSIRDMDDYTYWLTVYIEGSHFLYLLEKALGEQGMYDFVKEYVSRYSFKNSTSADFVATLYDVVGTDNAKVNEIVDVFIDLG